MLRFTPDQQAAINAARAGFNQTQLALAANSAAAMQMAGNASTVDIDAWRRIDSRSTQIMRDVLAVFNTLARANTTPMVRPSCRWLHSHQKMVLKSDRSRLNAVADITAGVFKTYEGAQIDGRIKTVRRAIG